MTAEALEGRVLLSGSTPVFEFKFDEGPGATTVSDTGQNGANPKNNGTLVGDKAPQWVPGPSGNPGDWALNISNFANPAQGGDPYYRHTVTGAVITRPINPPNGPFQEGLVQLSNNVNPDNPTPVADLSSVLNGSSSLAAWVKTTATGDNNSWAAPSITGSEGNGLTDDIRWGYLDKSGRIGVALGDSGGVLSATPINDGAWHLIVMTRNNTTNAVQVYVDGATTGPVVPVNNGHITYPLQTHYNVIGAAADTTNDNQLGLGIEGYNVFNGALDDVRVFDHALSAAEVQALLPVATTPPANPTNATVALNNGLAKVTWTDNANNELSYAFERTPADPNNPTQPDNSKWVQVGSTGAVSGTGQQGSFTDPSSAYSGAKFFYRVRAFNSFQGGSFSGYATTTAPVSIPIAAPVDRYTFNENAGTTVADSGTPGGKNGTLNGPTFVPGPNGDSALAFDAAGTNYVLASSGLQDVVGGNASISYWLNTTATGTGAVMGTTIGSAPISLNWGAIDGSGHITVAVGTAPVVTSGVAVNDGNWHLVAMSRDAGSGEVKIYIDGRLDTTAISDTGNKGALFDRIGATTGSNADGSQNATYTYFTGQLDDLRLYSSVISGNDIVGLLPPADHAPAAATNLAATFNGSATLTWKDQADNEFSYTILRSESAGGPYAPVKQLGAIAGTGGTGTFTDPDALVVGHTYYYKLVVFNAFNAAGGGTSVETGPVSVTAIVGTTGVQGHFYNQTFWGGSPLVSAVGATVDFHWAATPNTLITNGGRASSIFTGQITAPETGFYQIVSNTDDDGYLFVDGVLVSQDPGGHGERDATVLTPITLQAGQKYNFALFQTNSGGGGAGAHLKWVTPSMSSGGNTTPVVIPNASLSPIMSTPAAPTGFALDTNVSPNPDTHRVAFTFNSDGNAVVQYQLQRSDDGGLSWQVVNQIDPSGTQQAGDGSPIPTAVSIEDVTGVPGQSYRYRVVGWNYDHTGTPSAVLNVTIPTGTAQDSGVQGRYYNGELVRDQDPKNFAVNYKPTEFTFPGSVDIDYFASSPDSTPYPTLPRVHFDSFSTVWTGKIRTDAAGAYTFSTTADDDAVIYVNGVLVSQNGAQLVPLTLAANTDYNFVLIHDEITGNAGIHMLWAEPGNPTLGTIPSGVEGSSGGLLSVMDMPYQQSVSASGVITQNPAVSAAGNVTGGAPTFGAGVGLTWTDQSLSELWFQVQRTVADAGNPNNPDNTKWTNVGSAGMNAGAFNDTTAAPGTTYFYRVRGANFDAVGPWSAVVSAIGQSFIVTGSTGDDAITLSRNADNQHIDVTMGANSAQLLISDPGGLTINGNGGSDTLVIGGNALPNVLKLNGSFTIPGTLTIGAGQTVTVNHSATLNGATLDVQGLSITGTGKLDLTNNSLKVHYTGPTVGPAIRGLLKSGAISSSDAAATGGTRSLGYGDAAGVVTVKYTRNGDANLDGTVDFNDLVPLAQNYLVADGNRTWSQGDFTYDGNVDFNDLVGLAQNYLLSAAQPVGAATVTAKALQASILGTSAAKPAPKPAPKPVATSKPASPFAPKTQLSSKAAKSAAVGDVLGKNPKKLLK
jgi:hypothetical protein